MPHFDLHVSATRIPDFADDDEFPEPDDDELLEEEAELAEELEPVEDEGFDISEFDEDDEAPLYDDDDELFIAGDEDLPDEPDDDDAEDENDEQEDSHWFREQAD